MEGAGGGDRRLGNWPHKAERKTTSGSPTPAPPRRPGVYGLWDFLRRLVQDQEDEVAGPRLRLSIATVLVATDHILFYLFIM